MRLSNLAKTILGLVFACAFVHAEPVTITPTVSGKGVVLGGGTVESGADVTLRAIPQVDWRFDHWEGTPGGQSQENPITLTAASGLQPTAVMASANGGGRFTGAPVSADSIPDPRPLETYVPPDLNAVEISTTGANALALLADRTVVSWNAQGGTFTVPATFTNVVAIDAGLYHDMVVRADGSVAAWSAIPRGFTNLIDGLSNVVAVAAGSSHSVALRNDGLVVAWGTNSFGQTNVPAGLRNVIAIGAGEACSVALKADGSLVTWGWMRTQSGDLHAMGPVPPEFTNIVAISVRFNYILGLRADGTVAQWGILDGFGTGMPGDLTNVVAVRANASRALAIFKDRSLIEWAKASIDPEYTVPGPFIDAAPTDTSVLTINGEGFGFIQADRSTVFVEEGEAVRLAPVTTGGQSFQWFRDGAPVAGATSSSLFIPAASAGDAGSYSLAIINGTNTVATPPTVVTVVPAGYPRVLVNGMEVRDGARLSGQAQITLTTTLAQPQIFYTLDGSTPTFSSTPYTAPFTLNQTTNVSIRALAISGDFSKQATNAAVNISVLPSYTFTVNVTGPGHVDVAPKQTRYFQNDVVSLEAIPNSNATFTGWTGALTGTNPSQQITVKSNMTVTAVFQDAPKYAATILDGGGTITVNPSGPQYAGTDVTISATPNAGWEFRDWSGDHTGAETSFVWHVEGPATFKANFDTTITVASTGPGHIVLDPDLPRYLYGMQVQVIPVAEFGNALVLWGKDAAGQSLGPWTLTVTNATPQISALFHASSTPAYQLSNFALVNNQPEFHLSGSAGTTVTLQATQDFVTWTDVKTVTIGSSGSADLTASIAPGDTMQFYRVKQSQ